MAILPGVIMAMIGPFGSFSAPLWMRFAYWVPTMATGAVIGAFVNMAVERSPALKNRPVAGLAIIATAVTIAMTGVAWGAGQIVFGPGAISFNPIFIFYVWFLTAVMMTVSALIFARAQRVATASAPVPLQTIATVPPLTARLPEKLKTASIMALQAEDHYVRVHTEAGSDLILMRLGDAMSEMAHTPGARTHRSWWVAKTAVKSANRTAIVLANGLEVPVSRGYASELKDAGWFNERK